MMTDAPVTEAVAAPPSTSEPAVTENPAVSEAPLPTPIPEATGSPAPAPSDTPAASEVAVPADEPVVSSGMVKNVPEVKLHLDLGRIAQDLQIRKVHVEAVVHLFDEGNTIPFITRYRKEQTGGLNEEVLRQIHKRVQQQRNLTERKQTILRNLTIQGKLTDELLQAILHCEHPKRLEDLYLPYKPKKKSLAAAAKERGLGELAQSIWNRDPVAGNLGELLPTMLNPEKGLSTVEDILAGVGHILAEQIAELPEVRDLGRRFLWDTARMVVTKNDHVAEGQGQEFKDYFNYGESVRHIPPHRILAINRGERENILKVKFDAPLDRMFGFLLERLPLAEHPHAELIRTFAQDAMNRLLAPSLEREIRRDLTERAEEHAVGVFARNLKRLLLQPPVRGKRILAIDPAYRTGCKLACLDETGVLLDHSTIHAFGVAGAPKWERKKKKDGKKGEATGTESKAPEAPAAVSQAQEASPEHSAASEAATPAPVDPAGSPPASEALQAPAAGATAESPSAVEAAPDRKAEAKAKLIELAKQHDMQIIAIGNGTASRETEELVAEAIQEGLPGVCYVIVNEAGASHYSTSPTAREEFPNLDATARGTISIGRRLQDPLSELVKIDPQNLGVGLYQHDIAERRLKESLEGVVESAVNYVGVDLNTASAALLRYVAGLNQLRAHAIVDWRKEKGSFTSRQQLREVPGIGEITFTQAAGFLRIPGCSNPLDDTAIHPEAYEAATKLLAKVNADPGTLSNGSALMELSSKLKELPAEPTAQELGLGLPTYHDVIEALSRPGRDPREELPPPIFKQGILRLEDLKAGMELKGTVQNVVDFGAFVDVGLKDSGLVHISQLANKFIRSPYDIVSVGDIVTVWVMAVDMERRRVSLTMIPPGTERRLPERRGPGGQHSGPPFRREPRGEHGAVTERTQEQGRADQGREERVGSQGRGEGEQRRFDRGGQGHRGSRFGGHAGDRRSGGPGGAQGGRFGGGGRRQFPPRQQQPHGDQTRHGGTGEAAAPPSAPPQPPPRPRREKPKPKLTEAALSGKAPLRTFGELKALFEAKQPKDEAPAPAPPPVQEPISQTGTLPATPPQDVSQETGQEQNVKPGE